jgi:hypothetical protein
MSVAILGHRMGAGFGFVRLVDDEGVVAIMANVNFGQE